MLDYWSKNLLFDQQHQQQGFRLFAMLTNEVYKEATTAKCASFLLENNECTITELNPVILWSRIITFKDEIVAFGRNRNAESYIAKSHDGKTWNIIKIPKDPDGLWQALGNADIVCSDSIAVTAKSTTDASYALFYSEDLVNWHNAYYTKNPAMNSTYTPTLRYANGIFVADGFCYSYDGKNWNTCVNHAAQANISSIAYGNGTWVITYAGSNNMSASYIYTFLLTALIGL